MTTYTKAQCKADMIALWGELARMGDSLKIYAVEKLGLERVLEKWYDCPCCKYTNHKHNQSVGSIREKCPVC